MNVVEPTMSDETVKAKTGKDWQTWFEILDAAGAKQMSHKEIVAFLVREYQVGSWWQQMLTVTYEQARGLRQKHEVTDGYQISRSKTIPAGVERVYAACFDDSQRLSWLADPGVTIRNSTAGKVVRFDWVDGHSRVDISFLKKGPEKTQVTIQHNRLADAQQAEEMKTYWAEALSRLNHFVTGE
ncbi:MAG: DUF4287 domain-containing protein [Chloroflexota bacterium]|nr:MAG: DUF4287 domain-containing protein [Chloroflexota bacterium]